MNLIYLLLALIIPFSQCSKILVIFQMPARSHYILGSALARGLHAAGHDVTVISSFGEKNPPKERYRDIVLTNVIEEKEKMGKSMNMFDREESSLLVMLFFITFMGNNILEQTLNNPEVQDLLNSNETFDVIIAEKFMNDALRGFQHRFKAPFIEFSTIGANRWVNELTGNPAPVSYVPEPFLSYSTNMTFLERTHNFLVGLYSDFIFRFVFRYQQSKLLKKYFPDAPPLNELLHDTPLVLLNEHESTNFPVPHVPNMISVGGFHVKPSKKLPEDLQKFLDNAKDGAVYFSMGSNLIPSQLPEQTKKALINALGSIKQKVLWKWDEDIVGLPSNFFVSKWFPQQDVLDHPNVKLFITHGGLLSTTETVYCGVPILALPVFGDQKMNANRAEILKYGITLPFRELTERKLLDALDKLLNNPMYRENALQRSRILKDRPIQPMDSAVYWVEYVIRHKGAHHLRVAGAAMPLYKYLLLDVIAFLLVSILVGSYASVKVAKLLCRRFSKCKNEKIDKKNTTKNKKRN